MTTSRPYQLLPIRRVDVYREVLARVEAYIRENGLKPGDRLPSDRELAEMLGVSRASVRQAIKVLESFGRVDAQQGSGTYVREPSHSAGIADLTGGLVFDRRFLRDLVRTRNAIELEVLVEAFERRAPDSLARLQAALDERGRALAEDADGAEGGSLNLSFEAALGEVCGNELLRRLQALLHELWLQALVAVGEAPGDGLLLHEEHLEVFARFRAGDLEGALAAFRRHLDMVPLPDPGADPTSRSPGVPDRLAPT